MVQILINLIENSIKFGRQSATRHITIDVTKHDDHVGVTVADTGPGIPRHALKKVFDDFYRVEDSREVVDIGFDEYLDSGAYCFIEWPEKIEALLPDAFVLIRIQERSPEMRRFEVDIYE